MKGGDGEVFWQRDPCVVVQGITGREGAFWTERMLSYGTRIVAGVAPGKGGQDVHGVPVYGSMREVLAAGRQPDLSVIFVPPLAVKAAALEAIEVGVRVIVVVTEHVPVQDTLEIVAAARDRGARLVGPNCPGVVVPGRWFAGVMPAWMGDMFRPGRVAVISRSGSLGALICIHLVSDGLGQSVFMGVGGDSVAGTSFAEILDVLEEDSQTDVVVLIGEIGGTMEEEAAAVVQRMRKKVVAYIAGVSAPSGRRMGHAGAIVMGERGSAGAKRSLLAEAGALVAEVPWQIPGLVRECGVGARDGR